MFNEKLMERIKKKGKKLSPIEQKAKMNVVQDLHDQAGDKMKDKLDGLKKISIASDSPEGLKKGLEMAKDVIAKPEMMPDFGKKSEEADESEEESYDFKEKEEEIISDVQECSAEDLDDLIKKLEELKKQKEMPE